MKIGILFDLDGTLLDTLEDLTDGVNYALRQYNLPEHTLEEIRSYVGSGARNLIIRSLPGKPNDPPVDDVLKTYQDYYALHSQDKTGPYPGILEALAQLKEKYPLAIVSNKHDTAVQSLCRDYFGQDIFALGERADCPRKPAPDMLFKAMAAIGADKGIYVGDSDVDVLTAKNAQMPCLSVLWGFRDKDCIAAAGGSRFCDDPAKLTAVLEQMIQEL